jgi:hypothetical protein
LGQLDVWVALALAAVWVATGRWRYHPRPEGRSAEEVAAESRRRSRLVNRSILAVAALWILTDVVITIWAMRKPETFSFQDRPKTREPRPVGQGGHRFRMGQVDESGRRMAAKGWRDLSGGSGPVRCAAPRPG